MLLVESNTFNGEREKCHQLLIENETLRNEVEEFRMQNEELGKNLEEQMLNQQFKVKSREKLAQPVCFHRILDQKIIRIPIHSLLSITVK